mgnify:CR=1 FL=1
MWEEGNRFKVIVNAMKYTACDSNYRVTHEKSPSWYGVHYVTDCTAIRYDDGKNKVRLNQDCVYFFPANTNFKILYEEENPANRYCIFWISLLARPGLCESVMEYRLAESPPIQAMIPWFRELTRDTFIKDPRGIAFIRNSFASALLAVMNDQKTLETEENRQMEDVVFYIYQNLGADLRIDRLAGVAMLNRNDFYRKFTEALKMPPHKYVTEIRMLRAKELLGTGCKMSEIAHEIGFSDEKVFSRAFRNHEGVSPLAFRTSI